MERSDRSTLWTLWLWPWFKAVYLTGDLGRTDFVLPCCDTSFPLQRDLSCQRFLDFHGNARARTVHLQPHAWRRLFVGLFLALQFLQMSWRIWQPLWHPSKKENNTTALQNYNKHLGHCQVFQRCFNGRLSLFKASSAWPKCRDQRWWGSWARPPGSPWLARLDREASAAAWAGFWLAMGSFDDTPPPRAGCHRPAFCQSTGLTLNGSGSPRLLPLCKEAGPRAELPSLVFSQNRSWGIISPKFPLSVS